jgi:hypothetical protein
VKLRKIGGLTMSSDPAITSRRAGKPATNLEK